MRYVNGTWMSEERARVHLLEAEVERLRDVNAGLRGKIAAARIRLHPGHPAYKHLADDEHYQEHR